MGGNCDDDDMERRAKDTLVGVEGYIPEAGRNVEGKGRIFTADDGKLPAVEVLVGGSCGGN